MLASKPSQQVESDSRSFENPLDSVKADRALMTTQLGDIEIGSGRPEAAIIEYRKSLDAGDHTYWNYANLAASYALLGKMDEAKPYVAETLRVNPSFTIKWYREHAEDIPKRTEGLRKAGFSEE